MRTNAARNALGVAAAALLLICLAAPSADARSRCNPRHSVTLVRSSRARVYHIDGQPRTRVYGCLFRTHRRHRLPVGRHARDIQFITLSNRYVAYSTVNGIHDATVVGARSYNLKRGRTLRRVRALNRFGDLDFEITDLILTPHGSGDLRLRG